VKFCNPEQIKGGNHLFFAKSAFWRILDEDEDLKGFSQTQGIGEDGARIALQYRVEEGGPDSLVLVKATDDGFWESFKHFAQLQFLDQIRLFIQYLGAAATTFTIRHFYRVFIFVFDHNNGIVGFGRKIDSIVGWRSRIRSG
jgi:hypothetical protein